MEILKHFNSLFWSDYIWLPPNFTWEDIRKNNRVNYAQFHDLHHGFKIAVVLLVVRYVLIRYIFSPLECYFGLGPKTVKKINYGVTKNEILEKAFSEDGNIKHKQVQGLAKQLDWSEGKVERWIRRRLSLKEPRILYPFTEEAWRWTFRLCVSCYGLYALWDKPWLWDSMECFLNYPHHGITNDVWWYYMLELGFYWLLTIYELTNKSKYFAQMFLHHIVTILLLTLSWTSNFFRIGTLVLVIHEFSNISLMVAKMAKCVEIQRVADGFSAVFTVFWIVSRLVLFPCRVIYYTVYGALFIVPLFPVCYIFNSLLCILQILNIVWAWRIVKTALRTVSSKDTKV